MLQCSDRTLYTGITTDLQRRLREHNEAKAGARYTRVRRPVTLVYSEPAGSRSEAARREAQIKKLSRCEKLLLVASLPPHNL
ncbi:MAG: GIY-YIG nuclease family protein [Ketobacter sp.]|uniref:GIY-YIG nuclease family protein n=1 Tax=unclassified Ketobacter TaxID=2639109 RepID=UPI0025C4D9A6|nr:MULTISPECIES: GIY-YIG nuclease family protein [unclassified Ketobacter]|tara:strand:- start:1386 stop:1631 length:246 start_codon:yes stop_codon:yes gene_type:complete